MYPDGEKAITYNPHDLIDNSKGIKLLEDMIKPVDGDKPIVDGDKPGGKPVVNEQSMYDRVKSLEQRMINLERREIIIVCVSICTMISSLWCVYIHKSAVLYPM
jgi:hypothetical protein